MLVGEGRVIGDPPPFARNREAPVGGPGAVKGARFLRAAKRTLDGEDR